MFARLSLGENIRIQRDCMRERRCAQKKYAQKEYARHLPDGRDVQGVGFDGKVPRS